MLKRISIIVLPMVLFSACTSFYEVSYEFNREFEQGNIDKALHELRHDKQYSKNTTKLLYYLNNGLILSMQGKYQESNKYFEKAYLFAEDYQVDYLAQAASFLTNPAITIYRGEDHEHLLPLYYKALNFAKMERFEEALVECRRLNTRLQQLSDKYKSENRYQRDAFIHNLMGIIYQASSDWNNAFIAYRNAYDIYEEDYTRFFGLSAPEQLKKDLLNSAWQMGFQEEFNFYKDKFGWPEYQPASNEADLVFLWHNGLGPVKDEWSINFALNRSSDNLIVFTGEGVPYSFPYAINSNDQLASLSDLEMVRVAFPRYVERPVYFSRAYVQTDTLKFPLQLAEDVNKIAFKSLEERMALEFSKSLLRVALKKAAEAQLRKEDKDWGAVLGVVNAMTEKADTRNWQTLPHSISYARVPLKEGLNEIQFVTQGGEGEQARTFTYSAEKGQTLFHTFTSLESRPAGIR